MSRYFHDYDNVAILDLNEELAMGEHAYEIASLFPRNEAAEQWAQPVVRRYEQLLEERLVTDVNPSIYDTYVGQYEVPAALKDPSPPLTVIRDEVLLSDSVRLAERARASNVHDESKIWPSMWHVFQSSAAFVPEARQSLDEIGRFVVNHVG